MSTPQKSLFSLQSVCQKFSRSKFDKVLAKNKFAQFFWDTVYYNFYQSSRDKGIVIQGRWNRIVKSKIRSTPTEVWTGCWPPTTAGPESGPCKEVQLRPKKIPLQQLPKFSHDPGVCISPCLLLLTKRPWDPGWRCAREQRARWRGPWCWRMSTTCTVLRRSRRRPRSTPGAGVETKLASVRQWTVSAHHQTSLIDMVLGDSTMTATNNDHDGHNHYGHNHYGHKLWRPQV